jgi:outer membrane protein assembly factor BamB
LEETRMAHRLGSGLMTAAAIAGVGLLIAVAAGQTAPASRPAFPDGVVSAAGITHTLLLHAPIEGKVYKVSGSGDVVGEYDIGKKGEDSWLLPSGRVLGSYSGGVREIDPATGKVMWEYKAGPGVEVHSCQPVDGWGAGEGGRVLVCECGSKRLFEIQRDLKVAWEIQLESAQPAHKQFRLARKTDARTYLVAYGSDAVARELDAQGKVLRTFTLPPRKNGGVNGAFRLANGNTLVTGGYGAEAYEFDGAGKIVWTLSQADLPAAFVLHYLGTAQRLANGNTVFSNFQGEPAVFEVDKDKKVVWQYHNAKIGPVSAAMVVEGK